MAKELMGRCLTRLEAKITLDSMCKKPVLCWPKPALLHCYNDNNDDAEIVFCWIADFPEDNQRLFIYCFKEDPQIESKFDDYDIIWLSTPTYFICNHGSFALVDDPNYGMRLQRMDPITNLSIATKFALCHGLNPEKLLLCAQKDCKTNKIINFAWVDVSDENLSYIPVWSQYEISPEQTWNPVPLHAGEKINFKGCVYEVVHTYDNVLLRECRFTPRKTRPKLSC